MSTSNGFLVASKQTHSFFGSNHAPNFPSPTSNSVAMRISALEKKPGTPSLLNLAGVINGSQQKSTTAPMSPRSTVFRTKPIIHVDMDTTTESTTTKLNESKQKQTIEKKVRKIKNS